MISYASMAAALSDVMRHPPPIPGMRGRTRTEATRLAIAQKVLDFGYRAVHEMTVKAKLIIAAYYGRAPRFSYWSGCSTGGRQALVREGPALSGRLQRNCRRGARELPHPLAGLKHLEGSSNPQAPGRLDSALQASCASQRGSGSVRRPRRPQDLANARHGSCRASSTTCTGDSIPDLSRSGSGSTFSPTHSRTVNVWSPG